MGGGPSKIYVPKRIFEIFYVPKVIFAFNPPRCEKRLKKSLPNDPKPKHWFLPAAAPNSIRIVIITELFFHHGNRCVIVYPVYFSILQRYSWCYVT